ncbi:hypothetical protein CDAR_449031 [Caerostris darwini]|uniref:Uncharacterized protein n=1 Tax=Caerostris darwini TaxID=1538125 RepID=A0AAV4UX27_9ARAC|nr:hypothetical protein CDAR_449031 [Caerostris darwini]
MSSRAVTFDQLSYSLHKAVLEGDYVKIKELLKAGANIDQIDKDGNTEIHSCVIYGQLSSVIFLQELGADINIKNKNGNTPLHLAVIHDSVYTLNQLIKMGPNIDLVNKKGNTALHEAIIRRRFKSCFSLINAGADVDIRNDDGDAPIHLTSMYGFESITNKLIKVDVDINSINIRGKTALHEAIIRHHWGVCFLLIRNGASVNLADANENKPLHLVLIHEKTAVNSQEHTSLVTPVQHCSTDAFKMLRKYNSNRETPLHLAAADRESFFESLIQHGANINCTDLKGRTPLHKAVYQCNPKMTLILMQNGANMHSVDVDRISSLDMMMTLCTSDALEVLRLRQEDCCMQFQRRIIKEETVNVEDLLTTAKVLFKFDILKNQKSSVLFQDWFTRAIPRDLRHYLKACMKEIRCMKKIAIHKKFSLYNFIMEDKNSHLSRSVCSEQVLKYIFGSSTKIGFPIYCDAIIPKLEKDSLQQKLLESKIYTRNESREVAMDGNAVAHILKYLSKFDIFHLISAYSDGERTASKRKRCASILVKGDALPKSVRRKRH